MAWVDFTFDFAQGWTDLATGVNGRFQLLTTDGQGDSTCGDFYNFSLLHGQSDSDASYGGDTADSPNTWHSWGVPSGAIIDQVQILEFYVKCVSGVTGPGASATCYAVISSDGTLANQTSFSAVIPTVNLALGATPWVLRNNGGGPWSPVAIMQFHNQAANSAYLRLELDVGQGTTGSSTPEYRFDGIKMRIYYHGVVSEQQNDYVPLVQDVGRLNPALMDVSPGGIVYPVPPSTAFRRQQAGMI